MKSLIALAVAGLISTPAFATKARLMGLGQDKDDGTFFIDDERSIFRNVAYINNYQNHLILEWGSTGQNFGTVTADTTASPKAEGGFLSHAYGFTYGVYLGAESDTAGLLRTAAQSNTGNDLPDEDNILDIFFGGGEALKWGVNLRRSATENDTTGATKSESSALAARLGAIYGDMEGYLQFGLGNESELPNATPITKFKGKAGVHTGFSYQLGAWRPFISYKTLAWEQTNATTITDGDFSRLDIGLGRTQEIGSGNLYTSIAYRKINVELKYTTDPAKFDSMIIPINVGYETKATDWLTLRSGIRSNLTSKIDQTNLANAQVGLAGTLLTANFGDSSTADGKRSYVDSTSVNAGATLVFGDLEVDGMIGAGTAGTLELDNMFYRTSMVYKF